VVFEVRGSIYDGFRVIRYHFLGLQKISKADRPARYRSSSQGPNANGVRIEVPNGVGCAPPHRGVWDGAVPLRPPPPQKICWEFYDGFRVIWCDITALESTQQEADTRVMLYAIYSAHNEGVDYDNDTDNCHRQLSLIPSWTVCTRAFDCQRPWMTSNWPTVALMRSVTLHMCSESTTKIWMQIDPQKCSPWIVIYVAAKTTYIRLLLWQNGGFSALAP